MSRTYLEISDRRFTFIEDAPEEAFIELASKPGVKSHFMSSYAWGEVSRHNGWNPHYVAVKDGEDIVATALLLQKPLVAGYCYFYVPRGFTMDYSDRELLAYLTKAVDGYCRRRKSLYFKIDPDIMLQSIDIDGTPTGEVDNHDLVDYLQKLGYTWRGLNYYFEYEQPRFTFRLRLDRPLDEIEEGYGRTTKNNLKTARASGVIGRVGNKSDLAEFKRLMAMTEKRQGFYSHPMEFYDAFYDILSERDMVSLYLGAVDVPKAIEKLKAEIAPLEATLERLKDNDGRKATNKKRDAAEKLKPLKEELARLEAGPQETVNASAYLNVHYADKSWTLYGANDMDYRRFYANYLIYHEQIADAHDEGRAIFDGFGTIGKPDPTGHLNGLFEFKKKWGGEYTEFIGEFDYIENPVVYGLYKRIIPVYHKFVQRRLAREVAATPD